MACARNKVVQEGEIGVYHVWSRCAQQLHLMGHEEHSRIDFGHRREWLESLLRYQAQVFAIDVANFTILSNHFHLVVRTRPDVVETWDDIAVATRWKLAWPSFDELTGAWSRDVDDRMIDRLLADSEKFKRARAGLSSLSWFMARIKQCFSALCNRESGRSGAFWDARFGARELLDERAVLSCMAYVDLNQVQAGMASSLETSSRSAISVRLDEMRVNESLAAAKDYQEQESNSLFGETESLYLFRGCNLSPIGGSTTSPTPSGLYLPDTAIASNSRGTISTVPESDTGISDVRQTTLIQSDCPPLPVAQNLGENQPGLSIVELEVDIPDEAREGLREETENRSFPRHKLRTYHYMTRLFPKGLPARLSDVPILAVPLEKYIEIVKFCEFRRRHSTASSNSSGSNGDCRSNEWPAPVRPDGKDQNLLLISTTDGTHESPERATRSSGTRGIAGSPYAQVPGT